MAAALSFQFLIPFFESAFYLRYSAEFNEAVIIFNSQKNFSCFPQEFNEIPFVRSE